MAGFADREQDRFGTEQAFTPRGGAPVGGAPRGAAPVCRAPVNRTPVRCPGGSGTVCLGRAALCS